MDKKPIEPLCKNCLLYDHPRKQCKVAIIINGEEHHLPVDLNDKCHMDELGIPVNQVRWFTEDEKVKIEYPEGFFKNGV
jgi:hypothetical protein